MRKLHLLLGVCAALALAVTASTAVASGGGTTTCSGGEIPAGTYQNVLVTGNCTFASGKIAITGNLVVAPGGILNDHAAATATVHIKGNATVGQGGVLGLGMYGEGPVPHNLALVDGSVLANGAASLYLSGTTVRGDVVVKGGGDPTRNLPLKDDTVNGDLVVQGWTGLWFGVIRDVVGGNVVIKNNTASDPSQIPGSDSTEVATNTIGGNLLCFGNVPAAQIGDSGGTPNRVRGSKLGECAGL